MIRSNICMILVIAVMAFTSESGAQSTARYSITFDSSWNATDHGTLPGTAHWSDLVGATHNSSVTFWEMGQLATLGIEDVAEAGNNTNFNSEVNTAISGGTADQWLQAPFSPFAAISSATLSDVIVSTDHPLLTLASMVAPSPDWFIGVNGYSLLDAGNAWKTSVVLDMYVYDAGTEEGDDYSTDNAATTPHENIFSRVNVTPFNDQPIGTLTITLNEVLDVESSEFSNSVSIAPNPVDDLIVIRNPGRFNIEEVRIYDVLGQMVNTVNTAGRPNIEIQRFELNSGLYFVSMTNDVGEVATKKVILN